MTTIRGKKFIPLVLLIALIGSVLVMNRETKSASGVRGKSLPPKKQTSPTAASSKNQSYASSLAKIIIQSADALKTKVAAYNEIYKQQIAQYQADYQKTLNALYASWRSSQGKTRLWPVPGLNLSDDTQRRNKDNYISDPVAAFKAYNSLPTYTPPTYSPPTTL